MTKNEVGFDQWFQALAFLVYGETGVVFQDKDSVKEDYDKGSLAHEVAREIIEEYVDD